MRSWVRTSLITGVLLVMASFSYFSYTQSYHSEIITYTKDFENISNTVTEKQKKTILVFGDVMLDRYIRTYIAATGTSALFINMQEEINQADLVVFNLEGPITTFDSVVTKENLQFTFATHTAQDLASVGVDVVSLANNHTHNFGKNGLLQTRQLLKKADITFFGDPYNDTEQLSGEYSLGDTTISFIGYHQFLYPDTTSILEKITQEKQSKKMVIFFPHWGTEYAKTANTSQRKIAKDVVSSGADIVIGAHPHVIQNFEIINGKFVFYSLGNFIFDQWFSEDVRYGLAMKITTLESSIESVELKPFYRPRHTPQWLEGEERNRWCRTYVGTTTEVINQDDSCILRIQ